MHILRFVCPYTFFGGTLHASSPTCLVTLSGTGFKSPLILPIFCGFDSLVDDLDNLVESASLNIVSCVSGEGELLTHGSSMSENRLVTTITVNKSFSNIIMPTTAILPTTTFLLALLSVFLSLKLHFWPPQMSRRRRAAITPYTVPYTPNPTSPVSPEMQSSLNRRPKITPTRLTYDNPTTNPWEY